MSLRLCYPSPSNAPALSPAAPGSLALSALPPPARHPYHVPSALHPHRVLFLGPACLILPVPGGVLPNTQLSYSLASSKSFLDITFLERPSLATFVKLQPFYSSFLLCFSPGRQIYLLSLSPPPFPTALKGMLE